MRSIGSLITAAGAIWVRDARVVGDRTYILLLIADDDGAAVVKALGEGNTDEL